HLKFELLGAGTEPGPEKIWRQQRDVDGRPGRSGQRCLPFPLFTAITKLIIWSQRTEGASECRGCRPDAAFSQRPHWLVPPPSSAHRHSWLRKVHSKRRQSASPNPPIFALPLSTSPSSCWAPKALPMFSMWICHGLEQ